MMETRYYVRILDDSHGAIEDVVAERYQVTAEGDLVFFRLASGAEDDSMVLTVARGRWIFVRKEMCGVENFHGV